MPDPTRKTISATEISALFGVNPYVTRWMLYRKFAVGDDIETAADNRMDWGTLMEPLLLQAAAKDLKLEVTSNRGEDGKQKYVSRNLIGCTRDAMIFDPSRGPGACEAKCAFDYRVWMDPEKWDGGKAAPKQNEIQIQAQMYVGDGVTPYTWGVLSCWVGGEMHYFPREPLPELWAEFEKEAERFFDDVANKREPNPFGAPIEMPLLNRIYPPQPRKTLDFTTAENADELALKVRMAKYHETERLGHEKGEKAIKAEIVAMMGDAEEAQFLYGIKFTRKQSPRAGYTVKPSMTNTMKIYVPDNLPGPDIKKDFSANDFVN